jgi:hypothetical protein
LRLQPPDCFAIDQLAVVLDRGAMPAIRPLSVPSLRSSTFNTARWVEPNTWAANAGLREQLERIEQQALTLRYEADRGMKLCLTRLREKRA